MSKAKGSEFLQVLNRSKPAPGAAAPVLEVLDEFCTAIHEYSKDRVKCLRVPGFVTNYGQEYRIILMPAGSKFEHILLRAHVPAEGFPVRLDLYDEDLLVCNGLPTLRRRLKEFLQRSNTKEVINALVSAR
jgi:hypothetical protein